MDLNLIHWGLICSKILHPAKPQAYFSFVSLISWVDIQDHFLKKKKKSFDDIFSKKHPYREWRMEIPPMYNWSSDDKLISLILPVALELCRVQTNCSIKRHTNNTPRFPHCFDDFSWIWTFMSVSLNEIDLLHILPVLRKKPKLQTHTRNIIQSEETWYSRWNCS